MCREIPYTMGLEWRTLAAGFLGGRARTYNESPFEYVKVNRQIG